MKRFFLIILLVLVLVGVLACSGNSSSGENPNNALIGKWQSTDMLAPANATLEFLKDGTLILVGTTSTHYKIIDKSRVQIDGIIGNSIWEYTVSNDQMTMSIDGQKATFIRVTSTTITSNTKLSNAASWAVSQIGSTKWGTGTNTYCELFVENAFGTSGQFVDAYTAFRSIGVSGNPQAPGQVVYFDKTYGNNGNAGNGHAGIYIGNDQFISVISSGVQQSKLSLWADSKYLGYANPPSSWPGR
jgi:hypothetical protein